MVSNNNASTSTWPLLLLPEEKELEAMKKQQNITELTIVDESPEQKIGVDKDLLNCPICIEPLRPPVFQCRNGHWVCKHCRTKIHDKCPSCSVRVGFIRCLAIEKVVESALATCLYTQYGCMEKLSYNKMLEHEKSCKFTPISCPERGCKFIDVPKGLYGHFVEKHPSLCSPFTFNAAKNVYGVKEGSYKLLGERDEQIVFVLHRVAHPLGSLVNVLCVGPVGSDRQFSLVLRAKKDGKRVTMESPNMELIPECFAPLDVDNCLLIPNNFHEIQNGVKSIVLELVIGKVCDSKRQRIN